jgi:hypothetical protein
MSVNAWFRKLSRLLCHPGFSVVDYFGSPSSGNNWWREARATMQRFGAIGESGEECFLRQIRDELVTHTYRGRDEADWPILATALGLGCGLRTEDQDFFGTGVAVWTTNRIEILLEQESTSGSERSELS